MRRKGKHAALWEFLDKSGVLENGSHEDIQAVRREYRKLYMLEFKRRHRKLKPEFLVQLDMHSGEFGKINSAAKRHKMSVTSFLRLASLAYMERRYLIPNSHFISKLITLLESCLNEVRVLSETRQENHLFVIGEKYAAIEDRIDKLELQIKDLFHFPKMLEVAVAEIASIDPELRSRLQNILNNARYKNTDT